MSSSWFYHRPGHPCPLCGGKTDCRSNANGGVHCRRVSPLDLPPGWKFVKVDAQGFSVYFPDTGDEQATPAPDWRKQREQVEEWLRRKAAEAGTEFKANPSARFDAVTAGRRDMTDDERNAIASALCFPLGVLDLLEMKCYRTPSNRLTWTIPEKNGAGDVVGWNLRFADDAKRTYGHRGLFIATTWHDDANPAVPVIIPEGASDTLALSALSLPAVGRPSNTGGADHLADLLTRAGYASSGPRASFPVLIIGENDRKANGLWPGRDGAEDVARKLADALGRSVEVAYPPTGFKDVREFVTANKGELLAGTFTLAQLGQWFLDDLRAGAVDFFPAGRPAAVNDNPPAVVNVADVADVTTAADHGAVIASGEFPASCLSLGLDVPTLTGPRSPEPSIGTVAYQSRCPNRTRVLMRHVSGERAGFFWFDCRRLTCQHCAERKRAQYQATVKAHLADLGGETPVAAFWIPAGEWQTSCRALGRADASYFRLDCGGQTPGKLLIVATVAPSSVSPDVVRWLPAADAADKLCQAIDAVELREKGFTTSRDWKLIDTRKRASAFPQWERVTQVAASPRALAEILDHHRRAWHVWGQDTDFWSMNCWEFSTAGVDWDKFVLDVQAGEILPDIPTPIGTPAALFGDPFGDPVEPPGGRVAGPVAMLA